MIEPAASPLSSSTEDSAVDLITLLAMVAGFGVLFEGLVGLVMTLGAVWDGIVSRLGGHGATPQTP